MSIDTIWTVLGAIAVAFPVIVVVGTAVLLAAGGIIGCTRCVLAALTPESTPAPAGVRLVGPRYA